MSTIVVVDAACGLVLFLLIARRPKKTTAPHVIEGICSLHDAFEGIVVTGGPGSGKTSGPLTEI